MLTQVEKRLWEYWLNWLDLLQCGCSAFNRTCPEDRLLLLLWRLSEHNGSLPDKESKRFRSQITFKRISRKQVSNPISVWQPWKMRRRAERDQSPSISFNFFPRLWRTNFYHKVWFSIEYFCRQILWKFPTNFLPYFQLMQE